MGNNTKKALLLKCLWHLREIYYLDKDALIEASESLMDIAIYHQEYSSHSNIGLPETNKIVLGDIVETEVCKPPTFVF